MDVARHQKAHLGTIWVAKELKITDSSVDLEQAIGFPYSDNVF